MLTNLAWYTNNHGAHRPCRGSQRTKCLQHHFNGEKTVQKFSICTIGLH